MASVRVHAEGSGRSGRPAAEASSALHRTLRACGIDFFVSVPCKLLAGLIERLEGDPEIVYTRVTREEEGVGVMSGAALAGRRPAMLMQNSGLGNCINAICSLVGYYSLPMVFVVSHRGTEGESIDAQRPMGRATAGLLEVAQVPCVRLASPEDLALVGEAVASAFREERPLALL